MMYPHCCREIMLIPLGLKLCSSETLHRYVKSIQAPLTFVSVDKACVLRRHKARLVMNACAFAWERGKSIHGNDWGDACIPLLFPS
jgi:hypothetical protein